MKRKRSNRGPPFVEIDGDPYLNIAFDLEPQGEDIRHPVAELLGVEAGDLMVLRKLSKAEKKLLRSIHDDCVAEVWARIVGYR